MASAKMYKCDQCPFSTKYNYNLKPHVKTVHEKIEVETCKNKRKSREKVFQKHTTELHDKTNEENHTKNVDKITNFKCGRCNFSTKYSGNLKTHLKSVHEGIRGTHTPWRLKNDTKLAHANKREKVNVTGEERTKEDGVKDEKFGCHHCGHKTSNMTYLLSHMKTIHEEQIKDNECPDCNFAASKEHSLARHMKITHKKEHTYNGDECATKHQRPPSKERGESGQSDSKVIFNHEADKTSIERPDIVISGGFLLCPKCPYTSAVKRDFMHHIKAVHEKVKDYKCQVCSFASFHSYGLKLHIKSVHEKKRDFPCKICSHTSSYAGNLKKHVRAVHGKIRDFSCHKCSFKSALKHDLENHLKCVHDKIRDFKCTECNLAFGKKLNLQRHIKVVHDKAIKKFSCGKCDYKASTKEHVKRHMSVHQDRMAIKCEKCCYTTTYRHYFRNHMKSHEERQKVKCSMCSYTTLEKPNLTRHMKAVHEKVKDIKCTRCNFSTSYAYTLKLHFENVHDKEK